MFPFPEVAGGVTPDPVAVQLKIVPARLGFVEKAKPEKDWPEQTLPVVGVETATGTGLTVTSTEASFDIPHSLLALTLIVAVPGVLKVIVPGEAVVAEVGVPLVIVHV